MENCTKKFQKRASLVADTASARWGTLNNCSPYKW
jgi:hypothetical protein